MVIQYHTSLIPSMMPSPVSRPCSWVMVICGGIIRSRLAVVVFICLLIIQYCVFVTLTGNHPYLGQLLKRYMMNRQVLDGEDDAYHARKLLLRDNTVNHSPISLYSSLSTLLPSLSTIRKNSSNFRNPSNKTLLQNHQRLDKNHKKYYNRSSNDVATSNKKENIFEESHATKVLRKPFHSRDEYKNKWRTIDITSQPKMSSSQNPYANIIQHGGILSINFSEQDNLQKANVPYHDYSREERKELTFVSEAGTQNSGIQNSEEAEDDASLPRMVPPTSRPDYDVVMPINELNQSSVRLPTLAPDSKPYCPLQPPKLKGLLTLSYDPVSYEELEEEQAEVNLGGRWKPRDCISRTKVALIIPYRDRDDHLRIFLAHMHPFLQAQQLDYGIYVVELAFPTKFNRAILFNIGFTEAQKDYGWDCYIFHDVDLLPEEDHNLYTCPSMPRHMSAAINTLAYRLPYSTIMGGVVAMRTEQYKKVNGFSNMFFGWGAEDDDFYNRVRNQGYRLTRYPMKIARYRMLRHLKSEPSKERFKFLKTGKYRFEKDGLNSLEYRLLNIKRKKLFTWVHVDVDQHMVQSQFMVEDEKEGHVPEGLLDPEDRVPKHFDYSHIHVVSMNQEKQGKLVRPSLSPAEIQARNLRKAYLQQIHQQIQEELKQQQKDSDIR